MLEIVEVNSEKRPLLSISIERPERKLLGQTIMQADGSASLVTLCMIVIFILSLCNVLAKFSNFH